MNTKRHLILLLLITIKLHSSAQDFVDIRPYGESSCLEFMTQAYRGNIIAVETESGIPYKFKLNKIKQIEWVIRDSSAAMYSMFNTGDLIGAYSTREDQTTVICRDRFAKEKWRTTLNYGGYSYTFLELNDNEFLIGGGFRSKSIVAKMNIEGDILWTTYIDKSIYHLVTSEQLIFHTDGGFIISAFDFTSRELVFIKLDPEGNKMWEKSTPFGYGEGGVEIFKKNDGNYLVYEPDPEDRSYSDYTYQLLEFDNDLNLISKDNYEFFHCSSEFTQQTPYIKSISYRDDSLLFTGVINSYESSQEFLFFVGMDNCGQRPILIPNPILRTCPYDLRAYDRIMQQRGQDYVFAFDYKDANNYYPRFSNTSVYPYSNPRYYNVKVNLSSDHCQIGTASTFTNNWLINLGNIQTSLPEEGSLDIFGFQSGGSFSINSNTFGYDHCILEAEHSDSVKITVFPSEESGLGIQGAFSKNSPTPDLHIKYWSHGRDKVTAGKVELASNIPLTFSDDRIIQADNNGRVWQLPIANLEPFNWYMDTLKFSVDNASASDSLMIQLHISGDAVTNNPNYLNTRTLYYDMNQDRFGVRSFSGSESEVRNNERILFYLSYTNTTADTILDLQFYCDINDFNVNSGMLELSSHPVKARRATGPSVALYSMDFHFPNINLTPDQTAYLYFSINPGNKDCGSILKNEVTTVVDYQHQDTVAIPITLVKQTTIELDTQLISGSNFKGYLIHSDTTVTIPNMDTHCDTLFIYNISVTTTTSSNLSHYGIKIGPNPFRNYIAISDVKNMIGSVRVMDISGNEVPHQYFSHGVSIDQVTPGVYLLDISLKDGSRIRQKILKM